MQNRRPREQEEHFPDYWEAREKKLEAQAQKAESQLFSKCVFYILGFVGRGQESRLNLSKTIEKNGGRSVLMMNSHVTHIVARNLCHSKRTQLNDYIEKRRTLVIDPQYILDCDTQQKLLDPTPYITAKQKSITLENFLAPKTKK